MAMVETEEEEEEGSDEMESGIFRFEKNSLNVVFMDPVRVLNCSYSRYMVSPSAYYSRFFFVGGGEEETRVSRKRKRKEKKSTYALNEREQSADQRHQEARPLLLKAYEALLGVKDLLLSPIRRDLLLKTSASFSAVIREEKDVKQCFIQLGSVWQAPMYTISLHHHHHPRDNKSFDEDAGLGRDQSIQTRVMPVFNNLIRNETTDEMEAEFLNHSYILPGESCFYMSDLKLIRDLIPATPDNGFNLIVIDPPWENGSASQKSVYPTLPGRYFLSLPIKQLTHTEGALVALWVTNKEKLRSFIEKELFPMWGVSHTATFYWLKVKADGSLISELDLFHHRPYECLLLGYCHREGMEPKDPSTFKRLQENHVIISIPGEYSRKPPLWSLYLIIFENALFELITSLVGFPFGVQIHKPQVLRLFNLLLDYVPGPKPARCIELFARELFAGWTSWGNEPLRFQESKYFMNRET